VVADDSELFRISIARSIESDPRLRLAGSVADGQAALQLIGDLRPSVATIDVRMPLLDGEAVLNRLSDPPTETRVLLLSAHLDAALIGRALGLGAAGCLSKDDSEGEIRQAIVDTAGGQTVVSAGLQPLLASYFQMQATNQVRLSGREREVLELASRGNSAKQIACELIVSTETVKTLLQRASRKLETNGKTHAVAEALRRGLLS